jgi:hypothetical protein
MAALKWKPAQGVGAGASGGQGSCGGSDCGGNTSFPAGALPTATIDIRNEKDLSFNMPDGNVVGLTVIPHTDGTILYVDLTLNNIASAGLPKDVPIYPGAVVQMINPGQAEFQINANIKLIENYYYQKLINAGWVPAGTPMEVSGTFMEDWIKGNQKITITLVPSEPNIMLMIDCPTCVP